MARVYEHETRTLEELGYSRGSRANRQSDD